MSNSNFRIPVKSQEPSDGRISVAPQSNALDSMSADGNTGFAEVARLMHQQDTQVRGEDQYPCESVGIPSDGYFYPIDSPLSAGTVKIRPITAKEEEILSSQNLIKKGIALDEFLKSVVATPGVLIDDLLLCDKDALMVATRILAYGNQYPVSMTCSACEKETELTLNLLDFKPKKIEFSKYERGVNEFELVLPISKKIIKFKLLTHRDDMAIDAELRALEKAAQLSNAPSRELTTRMKYSILSVDGVTDRRIIRNFVDSMPARDSLEFRNIIKKIAPALDLSFDFTCTKCDHTERRVMPMGVGFFWPNTGVSDLTS